MSPDLVVEIGRQALWLIALLVGPLLLSALAAGLLIGMFQAATSINEMTLSFIPKLIVLAIALMLTGSWMLDLLVSFSRELIKSIPELIGLP
ncbi:MAG: flagellar biosynthesis protein FliQ [Pseudohaliea sp.]